MKTIIEEPSSKGNLNEVVIHSLSTCSFPNTPLMLNGGSISLPFCRKLVFCEYTLDSNYVRNIECFKLTNEYFDIYSVYPFFCPLVYIHVCIFG